MSTRSPGSGAIGDDLAGRSDGQDHLADQVSGAGRQSFALDAGTGKVLWIGQPRQATNTAVAKASDVLFLLDDDGQLIVARASRAGVEPVKRYTVADRAWAQPAISGNRVFVKDASSLALWTIR